MLHDVLMIFADRWTWFLALFGKHCALAGTAILLSGTIGILLGIFINQHQKASKYVLGVTNTLYTIPDIAMFGFLIPFTGIGEKTAIIALTIYGLLPMVRNTFTGLNNVDASILEAAVGMGSTPAQVLLRIKLPLAFSMILSGFRNMVVMTLSVTGIAAYIGAGGLGTPIYRGIATNNSALILAGSLSIAVLAICADLLLGALENKMKRRWKMQ